MTNEERADEELTARSLGVAAPAAYGPPDLNEWRRRAVFWASEARQRAKELEELRARVRAASKMVGEIGGL